MLVYIEPMYRGPSRGPCIGSIYPTLLGFGGIHLIILSSTYISDLDSCINYSCSTPAAGIILGFVVSNVAGVNWCP